MKLKILIIFVVIVICGCSRMDSYQGAAPGTPGVTFEQAKKIAEDVYDVTEIEKIKLRKLTDSELENLNGEQLKLTPVYYVIIGSSGKEQVTVYISSNEKEHNFIIRN